MATMPLADIAAAIFDRRAPKPNVSTIAVCLNSRSQLHTLTEVFSAYMHKHSTYSRGDTRSNKPNVSTIILFYKCRLSYLTFRIAAAIFVRVFLCAVSNCGRVCG